MKGMSTLSRIIKSKWGGRLFIALFFGLYLFGITQLPSIYVEEGASFNKFEELMYNIHLITGIVYLLPYAIFFGLASVKRPIAVPILLTVMFMWLLCLLDSKAVIPAVILSVVSILMITAQEIDKDNLTTSKK